MTDRPDTAPGALAARMLTREGGDASLRMTRRDKLASAFCIGAAGLVLATGVLTVLAMNRLSSCETASSELRALVPQGYTRGAVMVILGLVLAGGVLAMFLRRSWFVVCIAVGLFGSAMMYLQKSISTVLTSGTESIGWPSLVSDIAWLIACLWAVITLRKLARLYRGGISPRTK